MPLFTAFPNPTTNVLPHPIPNIPIRTFHEALKYFEDAASQYIVLARDPKCSNLNRSPHAGYTALADICGNAYKELRNANENLKKDIRDDVRQKSELVVLTPQEQFGWMMTQQAEGKRRMEGIVCGWIGKLGLRRRVGIAVGELSKCRPVA